MHALCVKGMLMQVLPLKVGVFACQFSQGASCVCKILDKVAVKVC